MMYIVHRTQLYIDRDLYQALTAVAERDGVTLSEVVRSRLRRVLRIRPQPDALAAFDRAVGAWAGRRDLPPTEVFVRALRRSSRWKRHGLAKPKDRRR